MLDNYREKLHALLGVQCRALESLIQLQDSWVNNVDGDAAAKDELQHFHDKLARFKTAIQHHENEQSALLVS